VLAEFGAKTVSDLTPEQYPAVITAARALQA